MYAGKIVESGGRMDILHNPRHPYTHGLLRSMPGNAEPGQPLSEIPGVVPPAGQWPAGCRFSTRCRHAFEPCPNTPPPTITINSDSPKTNSSQNKPHTVSCHLKEL
jgi:peptide/nickel transport system ATP-binding protein